LREFFLLLGLESSKYIIIKKKSNNIGCCSICLTYSTWCLTQIGKGPAHEEYLNKAVCTLWSQENCICRVPSEVFSKVLLSSDYLSAWYLLSLENIVLCTWTADKKKQPSGIAYGRYIYRSCYAYIFLVTKELLYLHLIYLHIVSKKCKVESGVIYYTYIHLPNIYSDAKLIKTNRTGCSKGNGVSWSLGGPVFLAEISSILTSGSREFLQSVQGNSEITSTLKPLPCKSFTIHNISYYHTTLYMCSLETLITHKEKEMCGPHLYICYVLFS
jgi:hypothetical protein